MNQEYIRPRLVVADALRGFALMGLFIVHMVEYFELYWYNQAPGWVHNSVFFLFGAKAYGVFALLFGLSFYIILDNYSKRGVDFRLRFIWRIVLLFLIGYLHGLIYAGDILQVLAFGGLFLAITHTLSNRWIVCIALFLLLQVTTLMQALVHFYLPITEYIQPLHYQFAGAGFEVFAHGSFFDVMKHNTVASHFTKWSFFLETGRLWNLLGLMFVGVYLGRIGFFERMPKFGFVVLSVVISTVAYLAFKYLAVRLPAFFDPGMTGWSINQVFGYLKNLSVIFAGVVIFVAVFHTHVGERILASWAPAGRMTLSLYVLQSIVFVPLYYGYGLSWYGSMGQLNSLLIGIGAWLCQMVMAYYFMQHNRYGPLEKLWRGMTFYQFGEREKIATN